MANNGNTNSFSKATGKSLQTLTAYLEKKGVSPDSIDLNDPVLAHKTVAEINEAFSNIQYKPKDSLEEFYINMMNGSFQFSNETSTENESWKPFSEERWKIKKFFVMYRLKSMLCISDFDCFLVNFKYVLTYGINKIIMAIQSVVTKEPPIFYFAFNTKDLDYEVGLVDKLPFSKNLNRIISATSNYPIPVSNAMNEIQELWEIPKLENFDPRHSEIIKAVLKASIAESSGLNNYAEIGFKLENVKERKAPDPEVLKEIEKKEKERAESRREEIAGILDEIAGIS